MDPSIGSVQDDPPLLHPLEHSQKERIVNDMDNAVRLDSNNSDRTAQTFQLLGRQSSDDTRLIRPCPQRQEFSSCWVSDTTTPMTSRPHFTLSDSPRPLRRVRSRSLGASIEHTDIEWSLISPMDRSLIPNQLKSSIKPTMDLELINAATPEGKKEETRKIQGKTTPVFISAMYGMINATIVLPVLMSFGAIIYRDQAFSPYMPVLVKLTVVSGVVHQLCFSTLSSLPFAVGQVQDAGLIFLSSMASHMVEHCRSRGYDDETLLATTTIGLSLCTALLGCGLVLIGQFQLAQYVQLLPTSVVGGYLAFIGWFCGMSGVGLMAASTEVSFAVLLDNWQFVVPGIAGGVVIYVSVRYLRHMAVLPTCIAVLLLLFYSTLWATTTSIDKAAKSGWIRETDAPPPWYKTWEYLKLDKVAWSVIPELVLTELSMIFVVALSSSLDVAAIELELKEPLDYNGELKMVGLSNLVSGLTGGYTGSYIFSQSIFSLRAGIRSRIAGYVLAACQVVYLLVPFPILAYVPNFFFGSLLSMICVDLMYEWLWDVRNKVTPVEYMVCLATFGLIQVAGVEYGILLGVVVFLLCQRLGFDVGNQRQNAELDEAVDAPSIPINSTDGNPQRYGSL